MNTITDTILQDKLMIEKKHELEKSFYTIKTAMKKNRENKVHEALISNREKEIKEKLIQKLERIGTRPKHNNKEQSLSVR